MTRTATLNRKPARSDVLKIDVATFVRKSPLGARRIRRIARDVWPARHVGPAQISIAVVGDRRMANLTEQYTGRRYRTDVLAFELSDATDDEFIGQVVINCQLARECSGRLALPADAELAMYLIHGLLHLSGYDDRTGQQARRMHRKTIDCLRKAGFQISDAMRRPGR